MIKIIFCDRKKEKCKEYSKMEGVILIRDIKSVWFYEEHFS